MGFRSLGFRASMGFRALGFRASMGFRSYKGLGLPWGLGVIRV